MTHGGQRERQEAEGRRRKAERKDDTGDEGRPFDGLRVTGHGEPFDKLRRHLVRP